MTDEFILKDFLAIRLVFFKKPDFSSSLCQSTINLFFTIFQLDGRFSALLIKRSILGMAFLHCRPR